MNDTDHPRFQFVRQLGSGVLGEVHEVVDESTGESVRLKIFRRCHPRKLDTFRMEFEALSRLNQINLAKMLRLIDPASETNLVLEEKIGAPNLAFTQELVTGEPLLDWLWRPDTSDEQNRVKIATTNRTLSDFIPDSQELETLSEVSESIEVPTQDEVHAIFQDKNTDLAAASSIVMELAKEKRAASLDVILLRLKEVLPGIVAGLEYLHRFQKTHGNLRPSNIIVSPAGVPKLTDYGIVASLVFTQAKNEISLLEAPEYLPYSAPEIESGQVSVGSDLYALGCILFEAISGSSPFDSLEFDLIDGKRRLQPPPLSDFVASCPTSWGDLVDGLLRESPEERSKLADLLQHISSQEIGTVHIRSHRVNRVSNFRGRQEEIRELVHRAKIATDFNRTEITLIRGDTGSGKSALSQQTAHYLSRRGWLVLSSLCLNREVEHHQGWSGIAQTLANTLDACPLLIREKIADARSKASRMFDVLREPGDEISEKIERKHAILALHEVLKFVARERPILLVFDDIENASWDTSSVLIDLLCVPESFRALVLLNWTNDSKRAAAPRLLDDLGRTLIEYTTMHLDPILPQEGKEFHNSPLLNAWSQHFPETIKNVIEKNDPTKAHLIAVICAKKIYQQLTSIEQNVALLIAISSMKLSRDQIIKTIILFRPKSNYEQIDAAIESIIDIEFCHESQTPIFKSSDSNPSEYFELSHESIRVALLKEEKEGKEGKESTITKLYKKLATIFKTQRQIHIEYAHRGERITTAVTDSIEQAKSANTAFAIHRCATIWKWLQSHTGKISGASEVNSLLEWANAEYSAEEYGKAAELFERLLLKSPHESDLLFKQSESYLWANNPAAASDALTKTVASLGAKLTSPKHELFRRTFASNALKKQKIEKLEPNSPSLLAKVYYFITKYDAFILYQFGASASLQLRNLFQKEKGATTQALAISATTRHQIRTKIATNAETILEITQSISELFDTEKIGAQKTNFSAENQFYVHIIQLRFGNIRPDFCENIFKQADPNAHIDVLTDALIFAYTSLRFGARELATKFALDVIRSNYRNAFLVTLAYGILTQDAIYRNDLEGAQLYLELSGFVGNFERMTDIELRFFLAEINIFILYGEFEVAVARLKLLKKSAAHPLLNQNSKLEIELALFHALTSQYAREKRIYSKRSHQTFVDIKSSFRRLKNSLSIGDPYLAATCSRALALFYLLQKKTKKAERALRQSIDIIGDRYCPLINAISLEALSFVIENSNEMNKKGMFEQAKLLEDHFEYSSLLQLEGWPEFVSDSKK